MIETWKVVLSFPDYEVSNLGRVRFVGKRKWSKLRGSSLLKQRIQDGYYKVTLQSNPLGRKSFGVHRLVLLAFCPHRGTECRHLNADRRDNRLENLAWGTKRDNINDAIFHRNTLRGERHPMAKLRWSKAECLRNAYKAGDGSIRFLAKRFGIGQTVARGVINGTRWRPF